MIVAVSVDSDGRRQLLGMDIGHSEAEPFWTAFLRTGPARRETGHLRRPRRHQGGHLQAAVCHLAALPRPLHAQSLGPCRQEWQARRLRVHRHRLRVGNARSGKPAVAFCGRSGATQTTQADHPDGRRRTRHASLHDFPQGTSHKASQHESYREAQRRDQAQDRGRRHLPQRSAITRLMDAILME